MGILEDEFQALHGDVPPVSDHYYRDPRVAEAYDREMGRYSDTVDDIPFYVDLAKEAASAGHKTLELGCGPVA